jgi:hypothetical protein
MVADGGRKVELMLGENRSGLEPAKKSPVKAVTSA